MSRGKMEVRMGDREVAYDEDMACDCCGSIGAYDFMGDWLCARCARMGKDVEDDGEKCECGCKCGDECMCSG